MYLPIEVDGGDREGSIRACGDCSGRIKSLGDVYIAARISGGGPLNVVACQGTFDAKSRRDASMSINGGR